MLFIQCTKWTEFDVTIEWESIIPVLDKILPLMVTIFLVWMTAVVIAKVVFQGIASWASGQSVIWPWNICAFF